MNNWKLIAFLTLSIIVFLVLFSLSPKPPVDNPIRPDTVVVYKDTMFIHDTLVHAHLKPVFVHDTLPVYLTDTVFAAPDTVLAAESDTVFDNGSYFQATYFYPPLNYFQMKYSIKERIETKYVEVPLIKFKSGFGVGFQFGYGFGTKSKTFETFLGVGINYNFY